MVFPWPALCFSVLPNEKTEFAQAPQQKDPKTKTIRQAATRVWADSIMRSHGQITFEPKKPLKDEYERQTQGFESPIYIGNPENRDNLTQCSVDIISGIPLSDGYKINSEQDPVQTT